MHSVVRSLKSTFKPILTNVAATPMGLGHGSGDGWSKAEKCSWCLRDASGTHSSARKHRESLAGTRRITDAHSDRQTFDERVIHT